MKVYEEFVDEPWYCDSCLCFQYHVFIDKDLKRIPLPGAPAPNELNPDYPYVCTLCLELYRNLSDKPYWVRLHNQWTIDTKKKVDRLRPGSEYLGT